MIYSVESPELLERQLSINPQDRVLDVGGGHNPFPRADVIVDIDLCSGHHRNGQSICINNNQKIVQADICNLPFKDKEFDFVVCIHVLEHVQDPGKACTELMRVARRGFIEVPRKWTEFYAGHPTHRWLVDEMSGALVFEPIEYDESPFINVALASAWSSNKLMKSGLEIHRDISCIQLAWKGGFKFEVKGKPPELSNERLAKRHYAFSKNLLYWAADPNQIIFHAERAARLAPYQKHYIAWYYILLILAGRKMWPPRGVLPIRLVLRTHLAKILLKGFYFCRNFYRRILFHD